MPRGLDNITKIAAGYEHTVALVNDGTVACWGRNQYGQCTVPSGLRAVTEISGGGGHTLALKSDGTIACWGSNQYGQCTLPLYLGSVESIAAGGHHSVALTSGGTVVCWGYGWWGQCHVPVWLESVKAIAAGGFHTVALRSDGLVACWGDTDLGQDDVPSCLHDVRSISAGGSNTLALVSLTPSESYTSGELGPIGGEAPSEFEFTGLHATDAFVELSIRVLADLGSATEFLIVRLNGALLTTIFVDTGSDCPSEPDHVVLRLTPTQFNELIAPTGSLMVRLEATPSVNVFQCSNGMSEIELVYGAAFIDCNNDGISDSCEIQSNPDNDCDHNGSLDACDRSNGAADEDSDERLDSCELALGDCNLNNQIDAGDLAQMLALWGLPDPPCGDLDGDRVITGADLSLLLSRWGGLY